MTPAESDSELPQMIELPDGDLLVYVRPTPDWMRKPPRLKPPGPKPRKQRGLFDDQE